MTAKDPETLFRAFLNEREATGRTALYMAVEVNRPKAVETLLAFKADPNIPNDQGVTPLQLACEKGYQTCIRVLVRGGCNCSIIPVQKNSRPDSPKKTLIDIIFQTISSLEERAEILAYLLMNGATIEERALVNLINTLPESYRPVYLKAVSEAEKIRAKNLSVSMGFDVPLPNPSDPTEESPMDKISQMASMKTPLQ